MPGFITDIFALLCFVPLVRQLLLKRWLAKMAANNHRFNAFGSAGFNPATGNVYEHQGAARAEQESDEKGILIDQKPEPTAAPERKND